MQKSLKILPFATANEIIIFVKKG